MITLSITLGALSGLLQLVAYVIYGRHVLHDRINANAASWSIWTLGALLETLSYIFVTNDWVKNILPVVCAVSAMTLFAACLAKDKFAPLKRWEWFITVLDIAALLIWWGFQSAIYANYLLVFTAVLSFVPLFLNTWRNPESEHALPWSLWSLAYLLMTITVLIRWEKAEDLVYPLTFLALHLIIAIAAMDGSPKGRVVRIAKSIFK